MSKIDMCAVSALNQDDHVELAAEIDEVMTLELMAPIGLEADQQAVHAAKVAESETYLKQKKAALTTVIATDSSALNRQVRAITGKRRAVSLSPDATTKEHADAIAVPFSELAGFSRLPYPAQLSRAEDFCEKMQSSANASHISALGMTGDVTLLGTLATTLRSHISMRAEDWEVQGQLPGMSTVRNNYNRVLRTACRNIEAVADINAKGNKNATISANSETLISGLNARFGIFNTRLSHYNRKNSLGHHQKPDDNRPEGVEPNVPGNGGDDSNNSGNNGGPDKPPNPES